MPAEWEPHRSTWVAWPYNLGTWEGHLDGAEEAFVRMIASLLPHEDVHLLVPTAEVDRSARRRLGDLSSHPSLHLHHIETGDVWIRDYGPIFVVRNGKGARNLTGRVPGTLAWTKWTYNALGKPDEYSDLLIGDTVPGAMPIQHLPHFEAEMVLEGGSIDVNGEGLLLTTEQCLLHPSRNPSLTKEDIEGRLHDFLGAQQVVWLQGGIAGDDTDGHVDDVARFVEPQTIIASVEEDHGDENYAVLQENLRRLRSFRIEGKALQVMTLPMPRPFVIEGRRMAASYANFYIGNGVVLLPLYGQSSDEIAQRVLRECFPGREVIGIDCRELIYGYGAIHCSTQQQPTANGI